MFSLAPTEQPSRRFPIKIQSPINFKRLAGLGDVLPSSASLIPGQSYTFTFSFPWYSQYPSDSDAIAFLGSSLNGIATVTKASRALFSSNYVVTIVPSVSLTVDEFSQAFSDAWQGAPWYVAAPTFVQAEGGTESTQAGGLQQMVSSVTGGVAQAASAGIGSAVSGLLPWILMAGGILVVVKFGPQYMNKRGYAS